VLILLESHRALNTGHLVPHGATSAATPFLDSLARTNHYWTRMVAAGVPTINALLAIHLSVPQHPTRQIASEFTALRNESFTATLGRRGYTTRFFSAADPAWDNQTPWLRQWYQAFRYDRGREHDAAMFADMTAWMQDSLAPDKPFFVTAMSKTNHYPFNPVPGVRRLADTASLVSRMDATMAYTDSCLSVFFAAARREPWFDRTVFVILADHGFPLSEHGSSQIGHGLYTESVWLPLVISGNHPALGKPRAHHGLASQIDLAPTFFELAGIREANAHMGHSLLSPVPADRQFRFGLFNEQAFMERGPYRWHGPWGSLPREQGEELFDLLNDRLERDNLLARPGSQFDPEVLRDPLSSLARDLARLHIDVIEQDALWPYVSPDSGVKTESSRASDSLVRAAPVN
jgi:phosphoglycerol transferase MdoB-like AlkP superfamily enzyme